MVMRMTQKTALENYWTDTDRVRSGVTILMLNYIGSFFRAPYFCLVTEFQSVFVLPAIFARIFPSFGVYFF